MKAKTFNDNNRIVFVIEDCDEEIKKQLFDLLNPEVVGDVEAETTRFQEEQPEAKEVSMTNLEKAMIMLKEEHLDARTDKAFVFITNAIYQGSVSRSDKEISNQLNSYLARRFSGVDAQVAVEKLNDNQCHSFIQTFNFALAKVWSKFPDKSPEQFDTYSIEEKRGIVAAGISFFNNINKVLEGK